jgi:uncharacterized membrane protein required for colicin V production
MNIIDGIIVGVVIFSAIVGFFRGITKEIFTLLSWIGAVLVAYHTYPVSRYLLQDHIPNPMLADGASYLISFILALVILTLISYFLSDLVRSNGAFGAIDRSLGFGFGIVRGSVLLFICEMVIGCIFTRHDRPVLLQQSRFMEFIYNGSDFMNQMLPQKWKEIIDQQHKRTMLAFYEETTPPIDDMKNDRDSSSIQHSSDENEDSKEPEQEDLKKKSLSAEAQVAQLSNLKPKPPVSVSNEKNDARYSSRQKNNLDRLLSQQ